MSLEWTCTTRMEEKVQEDPGLLAAGPVLSCDNSCSNMLSAVVPSSSCEGMSVASGSTASTTPSSRSCYSESPEDTMAEEATTSSCGLYDESWPQHEVPSIVQQPPLLHRPQPRRLAPSQPLPIEIQDVVEVDVPFLLNYEENLAYGTPRLPSVPEVEDEDESLENEEEEEEHLTPQQRAISEEDSPQPQPFQPVRKVYSYVESYPDHRWDLARNDDVLSEGIY